MRTPLIAGNWKMNCTLAEARELALAVVEAAKGLNDREVLLAPPFTALSATAKELAGESVILAGQNVAWEEKGAFTGEISPAMLKDVGAMAAIIGHSERRQIFGESEAMINARLRAALQAGLMGIFCIGESLEIREKGQADVEAWLKKQMEEGLRGVSAAAARRLVIAYEPIWAIGTGKTASQEQAQQAHAYLRLLLANMYDKSLAEEARIVYGGSVNPSNIDELMSQPDIDGALVGGAALDKEQFARIIQFQAAN
ncbi:MAG: triose-phosphate isomerase [Desulfobulbaceae bacterium]|jgi:triosephosphate isomerase|nr:triose-phosphate isomerase [Desulfobulbaceae bacterium]